MAVPDGAGGAGAGGGGGAGGPISPTIALGWMLRSWFLAPPPSRPSVRMCHGAPETSPAPSRVPPAATSQYLDWARWPPQARSTADPVDVNETVTSALLLPAVEPECLGTETDWIVPPQIVSRRGMPEKTSATLTESPLVENGSGGIAKLVGAGRLGHIDEIPPPPPAQMLGFDQAFQVVRKSNAL